MIIDKSKRDFKSDLRAWSGQILWCANSGETCKNFHFRVIRRMLNSHLLIAKHVFLVPLFPSGLLIFQESDVALERESFWICGFSDSPIVIIQRLLYCQFRRYVYQWLFELRWHCVVYEVPHLRPKEIQKQTGSGLRILNRSYSCWLFTSTWGVYVFRCGRP